MNFFDIKKKKNKTIFSINCEIIDENFMTSLYSTVNSFSNIGLDMKKVKTIKSKKFIELLLSNKFKLFNLQNDILTYLLLIMDNGFLKSYLNESDFHLDKREFIKRRFLVVQG